MWIGLALLSALGNALTSVALKRMLAYGDALLSTVAFRIVAGLLLVAVTTALGGWHHATPLYWRTVAMVLPPEIGGLVCMSLALRSGDVSLVAPISGLLPVFVSIEGAIFLAEFPSAISGLGILLVATGVYCIGLQRSGSVLEPLLALARLPATRYAVASALLWSMTTVVHKFGVAEVGPLMWGTTVALGSGLVLSVAIPFSGRVRVIDATQGRARIWIWLLVIASCAFALQQATLQLALQRAQAGYVIALGATGMLLATALGVVLYGERGGPARIVGAVLATAGAALVAIGG
jgi:uncharacterized membrane protein